MPNNVPILTAQSCALTFIGNADNKRQQDAFFFLQDWFQERLGITNIETIGDTFCLAVSDGVSSSNMSQHCSKAIVSAIDKLWSEQSPITVTSVHQLMIDTLYRKENPSKYEGASATLAMVVGVKVKENNAYNLQITHVGDSRVYLLQAGTEQWQCLTRDHNLLNDTLDEQAMAQGKTVDFDSYNATSMASMLYTITDFFVFSNEEDGFDNTPNGSVQSLEMNHGDCLLICTDGIHDLVPSSKWAIIDNKTDLKAWLLTLKTQVYTSDGNAYDNGTAIVVRVGG